MKNNWKESFYKEYYKDFNEDGYVAIDTTCSNIEDFITNLLAEQKKELMESQIDKIKHEYHGYGGVLGFKCNDLIKLILKHHD